MTSPIIKITADKIAATYPIEWPVAVVEFHSGSMILADIEDLAEHGEAITIGLPGKRFPVHTRGSNKGKHKMSLESRLAHMRADFYASA